MNLKGVRQLLLWWLIGVTASALVTYIIVLLAYPVLVPIMVAVTVLLGAFGHSLLKLAGMLEQKIYEASFERRAEKRRREILEKMLKEGGN
ncbi:hypothetical protein [Candidatus Pyrohabitans sp.]